MTQIDADGVAQTQDRLLNEQNRLLTSRIVRKKAGWSAKKQDHLQKSRIVCRKQDGDRRITAMHIRITGWDSPDQTLDLPGSKAQRLARVLQGRR